MHGYFSPWYTSPFAPAFPFFFIFPLLILVALWSIAIKGYALWHAARNGQKEWFIGLLILNTVGILEIVYLVWFCPTKPFSQKRTSSHSVEPEVSSDTQA